MPHSSLLIPLGTLFWDDVAHALLKSELLWMNSGPPRQDFSSVRVVVPTFHHMQQLKTALAVRVAYPFIPPRMTTLSAWLAQQGPTPVVGDNERLMALYSGLRQHEWLKKLFTARHDTDLLPLARLLLTLCDELTQAWLPTLTLAPDAADRHWQVALEQLSPSARSLLSEEAQLVWSIWKSQLDTEDACLTRFARMMRMAAQADAPLVWVAPMQPDVCEAAFLDSYAKHQPTLVVNLDWCASSINPVYARAWPEAIEPAGLAARAPGEMTCPDNLSVRPAKSLEDEAVHGAQTILNWIAAGKSKIAVIAQDRIVARRLRALLERAHVSVADETGWKLSTTRAAATLAAWFEVVAAQAETTALLDFLKSPFLLPDHENKQVQVMAIESALRRANVAGGWHAVTAALPGSSAERDLLAQIAAQAALFKGGRKSLCEWLMLTGEVFDTLGMRAALHADQAGKQVIAMLDAIGHDCQALAPVFSFAEWRAFINMTMESTPFMTPQSDQRVVMLPLNGAHLRSFDAVLMIGADAEHLPSQPQETLFFANAVRRELGLTTREIRQRQQLRDFMELLHANGEVVLSWQTCKEGEPNSVSPWIARLQLTLARSGMPELAVHEVTLALCNLTSIPVTMPKPVAPQLLPASLSASGYNSLIACPYQFFANRMLGLSKLDELSDLPEKRDYGDWLHQILKIYHERVRDQAISLEDRAAVLHEVSEQIFSIELAKNSAALGYYARWKKALPSYLAWANERQAQGWQFMEGEKRCEKSLQWPGGQVQLYGRIDRIDKNEAGEYAVLDYKTQTQSRLTNKLKSLEDQQLAFYGLLLEQPVTCAHYVALEPTKEKTGDVLAPDYVEWQRVLAEHIVHNMGAIAQGAPLTAHGIESTCQYCDVRGLCRKGAW